MVDHKLTKSLKQQFLFIRIVDFVWKCITPKKEEETSYFSKNNQLSENNRKSIYREINDWLLIFKLFISTLFD